MQLGEITVKTLKKITASCNIKFVTKGLGILHKMDFLGGKEYGKGEEIGNKKLDLVLRRVSAKTASTY